MGFATISNILMSTFEETPYVFSANFENLSLLSLYSPLLVLVLNIDMPTFAKMLFLLFLRFINILNP